ncbi:unnamed protein product [Peronospora farinosa]|uniref:Uncharacterized protein n=1 Tax=Peronospora farinosa TaxID=134698 RepID=A0ABN8C5R2_9STRA|nr:unnamed protein product [Peronospora farinosa]
MEKDADDGDDNEELDVSKEEEFEAESVKSLDIGKEDKVKMEEVPKEEVETESDNEMEKQKRLTCLQGDLTCISPTSVPLSILTPLDDIFFAYSLLVAVEAGNTSDPEMVLTSLHQASSYW